MKRFAAVAVVLIGLATPGVFAQRGGGHGGGFGGGHGFSGRSAGAFHGGGFSAPHFSGFSAPRFSGGYSSPHFSPGFAPMRSYAYRGSPNYRMRYYKSYPVNPRSGYGYSSGDGHSGSYHHHSGGGFHWSITTVPTVATLVPGWIGVGPYGYYPYDDGYGWDHDPPAASSDDSADGAPQSYEQAPEQPEQPVYREEYEPPAPMPAPTPVLENQGITTVVFNDGRPSEQIRNYALTPTTLYVLDAQRRDIPLGDINIAATQKANRAVGIDFQIPKIVH
jgi:hypothetical protein